MTPGTPDGPYRPHFALHEQSTSGWAAGFPGSCAGEDHSPDTGCLYGRSHCCLRWVGQSGTFCQVFATVQPIECSSWAEQLAVSSDSIFCCAKGVFDWSSHKHAVSSLGPVSQRLQKISLLCTLDKLVCLLYHRPRIRRMLWRYSACWLSFHEQPSSVELFSGCSAEVLAGLLQQGRTQRFIAQVRGKHSSLKEQAWVCVSHGVKPAL